MGDKCHFAQADHLGRRFLLIQAGIQMLLALLVIAISLARLVPAPLWLGWYILAFILVFDSAYAWSWCVQLPLFWSACIIGMQYAAWKVRVGTYCGFLCRGPLGWLYPFEIQPLETRPAGGES